MNKSELAAAVADKTGLSGSDADKAVSAVFDCMEAAIRDRKEVRIMGFGNFSAKTRKARKGKNPATGEDIQIPEKTSAAFKPATALKGI